MATALRKQLKPTLTQRIQGAWKSLIWGVEESYWTRSSWGGSWDVTYGTRTHIDYRAEAGRLDQNAIIMACINFAKRAFPEAPIQVMQATEDGPQVVPAHPLVTLIGNPNPYYNGILLWRATIASLILSGNAYWLKVRNKSGQLIELWYEPHVSIRPRGSDTEFISHYEIYRRGRWLDEPAFRFKREDVVHFRGDLDPDNPRLGLSDLAAALREVFTDNEAASYSATMLRSSGVPPLVISPTAEGYIEDPEAVKRAIMQKTTGEHRGEPLVMQSPVKIDLLSFSPEGMSLEKLRRIPEERISGLIGIPAIVAGLGAGLDRSTYSNMAEAREQAYEGFIIPTQQLLAQDIDNQLLPDLGNPATEQVSFDLSQVRVLQEDNNKKATTYATLYKEGIATLNEARVAVGLKPDVDPMGDEYRTAPAPQPMFGGGDDVPLLPSGDKAFTAHKRTKDFSPKVERISRKIERVMGGYLTEEYRAIEGHLTNGKSKARSNGKHA